jgi:anti-sigma factor RsiW
VSLVGCGRGLISPSVAGRVGSFGGDQRGERSEHADDSVLCRCHVHCSTTSAAKGLGGHLAPGDSKAPARWGCRGTSRRRRATQRAHRGRRPHRVRARLQDGPGGPITSGGANQGERSQQLQRGQRPLQGINSGHQTSPTTKPATTNATRKTSVSMIRLCRPAVGSCSVGVSTMSPYTGS